MGNIAKVPKGEYKKKVEYFILIMLQNFKLFLFQGQKKKKKKKKTLHIIVNSTEAARQSG